jgi:uncharacterized OsmC-like protein
VLVLKRLHVNYSLTLEPGVDRDKVQRAFDHHMDRCPLYRSIGGSVSITTSLSVVSL